MTNVAYVPIDLANWQVTDGEGTITLTGILSANQNLWIARTAISFTLEFGYSPSYEYGSNSDPSVPDLPRRGNLQLADTGDQLILKNNIGTIVDSVVWGTGALIGTGWNGPTINPYTSSGSIGAQGQILYRKLDQASGQPGPDSDTAADWAQVRDDNINGKKVLRPGWDLGKFWQTAKVTATSRLTVAIAPGDAFRVISNYLGSAQHSIKMEIYSFDIVGLFDVLSRTMRALGQRCADLPVSHGLGAGSRHHRRDGSAHERLVGLP